MADEPGWHRKPISLGGGFPITDQRTAPALVPAWLAGPLSPGLSDADRLPGLRRLRSTRESCGRRSGLRAPAPGLGRSGLLGNVLRRRTLGDDSGMVVDVGVPHPPRLAIVQVVWRNHDTREGSPERLNTRDCLGHCSHSTKLTTDIR